MKKVYILNGLDCPHCSSVIENDVLKLDGVTTATVNLIRQTLTVEIDDAADVDNLSKAVKKIVHSHEPDIEFTEVLPKTRHDIHGENSHEHKHGEHCCHGEDSHEHKHGEHCCHGEDSHEHEHGEHCCHGEDSHEHEHGDHCCHDEYAHEHEHNRKGHIVNNKNSAVYILQGLDCPNCASEIEKETAKIDYVVSADLNFMKQTLTVSFSNGGNKDKLFKEVKRIVNTLEPDVTVIDTSSVSSQNSYTKIKTTDNSKKRSVDATVVRLAFGAVVYAVGFALSMMPEVKLYIQLPILSIAYIILGGDVVLKAVKNILKGRVFDENFLMTISTIGAFIIGEYPEAVAVMLFYQLGEYFQSLAVKRSRRSISELMDIRPDSANVLRNGRVLTVFPDEVKIGERILVKPGEKIPLDGIIVDGCSMLDTRALTGESVPKKAEKGDSALSGCINESGALTIEVTKKFGESTASKIIDLVENAAGKKAPTENFITTFSRYYTPIVVVLAALLALTPPLLFSASWVEWLHRGFVFLVISCPCALVISIPLTFFGGIGAASRKGVLVKGSNYLEALNCIETVVFDKTGTLTKGVFNVTEISLVDDLKIKNFNKGTLLEYAAEAECMSNHPIARSIVSAYGKAINESAVKNYSEFSGHGVSAEIDGHTVLAGNEKLMITHSVNPTKPSHFGTVVHVAVDGNYIGYIVISDELKADSKETVSKLKDIGINKTVMLTGDGEAIAKSVAESINLDEYYSELLPNQKVEMLEKLGSKKSLNGKLAFVGDGINDAPVLARADVGIAMGAFGSDAAIEAADVVLMTDEPSKLVDAIEVSRRTKRIVTQNIIIVIAIKILFLILGAFGVAGMWEAVFGDVGVMIIAVINAMRILKE